jgi:two-component system nitrogen regulation response regulator GlnG
VRDQGAGRHRAPAAGAAGSISITEHVQRLLRAGETDIYRQVHADVDRLLLDEILRHTDGNQVLASQLLGISRTTLRGKLDALGLDDRARL